MIDLLTTPADPDLFNEAVEARAAYDAGQLSEDAYLAVMALYQRAERLRWITAMRAAFA